MNYIRYLMIFLGLVAVILVVMLGFKTLYPNGLNDMFGTKQESFRVGCANLEGGNVGTCG